LEQPHELEQSTILQNRVVEQRQELFKVWRDAHDRPDFDQSLLEERMGLYENVLQVSVGPNGLIRPLSFHNLYIFKSCLISIIMPKHLL
jgi:hypothetical protein